MAAEAAREKLSRAKLHLRSMRREFQSGMIIDEKNLMMVTYLFSVLYTTKFFNNSYIHIYIYRTTYVLQKNLVLQAK